MAAQESWGRDGTAGDGLVSSRMEYKEIGDIKNEGEQKRRHCLQMAL